jgi:integrase
MLLFAAQGATIPKFTIHDFRRCLRSGLGRLGVPTHVAELCLGHKQRGIVATYDQYDYLAEKTDALERWEKHLLGVVAPPDPEKVVALPVQVLA